MGPDLTLPSPRNPPEKRYAEESPLASAKSENVPSWHREELSGDNLGGTISRPGHKRQDSRPSPSSVKSPVVLWSVPEINGICNENSAKTSEMNSLIFSSPKIEIDTECAENLESSTALTSSPQLIRSPNKNKVEKTGSPSFGFLDYFPPRIPKNTSSTSLTDGVNTTPNHDVKTSNDKVPNSLVMSVFRDAPEQPTYTSNMRKWTTEEDDLLRKAIGKHGGKNWKAVAEELGTQRTDIQCLHRWNQVLRPGLHKGPWTELEDRIVRECVEQAGVNKVKWSTVASRLPGRVGKQCRERWFNHLDPSIKRSTWTPEEDIVVFEAQARIGNRWCEIARLLPGRTENAVKNRFNSSAQKKWLKEHPNGTGKGENITPELLEKIKKDYEQEQAMSRMKENKRQESLKDSHLNPFADQKELTGDCMMGMTGLNRQNIMGHDQSQIREMGLTQLEQQALMEMRHESEQRFQNEMKHLQDASSGENVGQFGGATLGRVQESNSCNSSQWQFPINIKIESSDFNQGPVSQTSSSSNSPQLWRNREIKIDDSYYNKSTNFFKMNNANIMNNNLQNGLKIRNNNTSQGTPNEMYPSSMQVTFTDPVFANNNVMNMVANAGGNFNFDKMAGGAVTPNLLSNIQSSSHDNSQVETSCSPSMQGFSTPDIVRMHASMGMNATNNVQKTQTMLMEPPRIPHTNQMIGNTNSCSSSSNPLGFLMPHMRSSSLSIDTNLGTELNVGRNSDNSSSVDDLSKLLLDPSPMNENGTMSSFDFDMSMQESPLSQAVRATKNSMGPGVEPNENVPLDMLPFFRYLNNDAQRSIMKQLIDQFQHTHINNQDMDPSAMIAAASHINDNQMLQSGTQHSSGGQEFMTVGSNKSNSPTMLQGSQQQQQQHIHNAAMEHRKRSASEGSFYKNSVNQSSQQLGDHSSNHFHSAVGNMNFNLHNDFSADPNGLSSEMMSDLKDLFATNFLTDGKFEDIMENLKADENSEVYGAHQNKSGSRKSTM